VIALLLTATAFAAPIDFDAFFEEFSAKRDSIGVLQAEFEQRAYLPDEVLTSDGTLLYVKPRRILFRLEDPERITLIDGRTGYEYEPEVRQVLSYSLEDRPEADVFFLGFAGDLNTLREAYDVNVFETPDETQGTRGVQIRPKPGSEEEAYFQEVDLYLRDADFLPYRIHIINDAESHTVLDFLSYTLNGDVTPEQTQIALEEGTKVVENDQVVEKVAEGGKRIPEAASIPAVGEAVTIELKPADGAKRSAGFEITDLPPVRPKDAAE
jgi:outer membrane lipoprotein-sorting protein